MRESRITISPHERRDLLKAWLMISIAFAIVFVRGQGTLVSAILSPSFLVIIVLAGITVGLGFLVHELAHKIVAIKYGCSAWFRANNTMLWFAIALAALAGAVFAAPGAVMIRGHVSKKEHGHIAAAGPAANVVLAIVFAGLLFVPVVGTIAVYGLLVNGWLALFNMIPILPFDGAKIWAWSKPAYFSLVIVAAVLAFFQQVLGIII